MAYNAPPPVYVQSARTSTMAIVSLVAGIAGLSVLPVIASIVAVVTGHMAKGEIRDSSGMVTGDGLATAGLILATSASLHAVRHLCGHRLVRNRSGFGAAAEQLLPGAGAHGLTS
jgi:hypothetical protein